MRTEATTRRRRPAGFTLIELSIVIVIIGILIAFILTVGGQGVRNAEIRATQSLITKLDAAMDDLMQQIVNNRVDANAAHTFLAAIPNNGTDATGNALPMITSSPRAQVIANADNLRSLIPEVWFYQPNVSDYPINCGAVPYDPASTAGSGAYSTPYAPFALPMGNRVSSKFLPTQLTGNTGVGDFPDASQLAAGVPLPPAPTGMFGASFGVRGGLTKNLGYLAQGYDGQDNNDNGLIDELSEGTGGNATLQGQITTQLNQHTHKTARAEMLYAVLVEGLGPYGAVLNRDDFTTKEVLDTDNDGLPEFVDAWGQPLQFYLWPTSYTSDSQLGYAIYATPTALTGSSAVPREQCPIDADQQLMAPAWWANNAVSTYPPPASASAIQFSRLFLPLLEVIGPPASISPGLSPVWDRQTLYPHRRAYYTKPLICSSGPDLNLGLFQLDDTFVKSYAASPTTHNNPFQGYYSGTTTKAATWNPGENSAISVSDSVQHNPGYVDPRTNDSSKYYLNYGEDDLTNQTLYRPGGGIQ